MNSLQVLNLTKHQTNYVQEWQGSGGAQEWQLNHEHIWKHACGTAVAHSITSGCAELRILTKMRSPFWHVRWVSQTLGWKVTFVRLKITALLEALKWIMMTLNLKVSVTTPLIFLALITDFNKLAYKESFILSSKTPSLQLWLLIAINSHK